jgi:hypothetical protein
VSGEKSSHIGKAGLDLALESCLVERADAIGRLELLKFVDQSLSPLLFRL